MSANWYGWFHTQITKRGHTCIVPNWPDPYVCKRSVWEPFILNDLNLGSSDVVVGHSSGALLAMRLLEGERKIKGAVLVACAHTDLGDENERASQYFDGDWQFEKMRDNADWVVQFHSADDHLIPIAEGRFVAREIGKAKGAATYCYRELEGEGHFFGPCDEILKEIDKRVAGGGGGDD
ncbi:hypothetical protein TrRE_jg11622, partial [Triparma retinervis]